MGTQLPTHRARVVGAVAEGLSALGELDLATRRRRQASASGGRRVPDVQAGQALASSRSVALTTLARSLCARS
jgi:hypothetical protein